MSKRISDGRGLMGAREYGSPTRKWSPTRSKRFIELGDCVRGEAGKIMMIIVSTMGLQPPRSANNIRWGIRDTPQFFVERKDEL